MHIRSMKKTQSDVSMNNIIGTDKDGNDMELMDVLNSDEIDKVLDQGIEKSRQQAKEKYELMKQRMGFER